MRSGRGRRLWWVAILAALLGLAQPALALDPARRLDQYKHSRWTSENGAPTEVRVITQTPDGFLWLGADDGLHRFDGVTFERIPLPDPRHGHGSGVNALLVTRAGALVVGFDLGGVGIYDKGRFTYLADRRVRSAVRALAEDRQGALWAATGSSGRSLARYHDGAWRLIGPDWGVPPGLVSSLHLDRDGVLWLGKDHWLGFLAPGQTRFQAVATPVGVGPGLAEDAKGRLWISDSLGARRFADPRAGRVEPGSRFAVGTRSQWNHILVDRDQNLWGGGFGVGVFRVRAPGARVGAAADSAPMETYPVKAGLTGDVAWSVFEDREGGIWVGTNGGLDRFRHANVIRQPLVSKDSPHGYSVMATRSGAVLVSDHDALLRAEPGQALKVWFDDINPVALCEGPDQTLWIFASTDDGKPDRVFRVRNGRRSEVKLAWPSSKTQTCAVDDSGGLWVTALDTPGSRLVDGRWRAYAAQDMADFTTVVADGPGRAVFVRGRRLFQADDAGLRPLDYGAERHFPGSMVQVWRDQGPALIATTNGLTRLDADGPRFLSDDRFPWLEDLNGLARRIGGSTWIRGKAGVTKVGSADLDRAFADPGFKPAIRTFTLADGLVGSGSGPLELLVAIGGDNRVWLATTSGVFTIDADHLYRNRLPPPVAITAMTVDGKTTQNPKDLVLAKGAKSLQIDYAALSLAMPERVRFRYRLEGVDRDWVDPGLRRQAFYTNLSPGRYVFRVKASNEDGVWNETGASLRFDLPPTFLQSKLFLGLLALAVTGLAWLAYSLRLRQVSHRIRARLHERLAERERIARELHDTLLQGVQGLMLKFRAATNQVPCELAARRQLEGALERAEDVIVEARERVRNLRAARGEDLAAALAELAARTAPDRSIDTKVQIEGAARSLHPVVADEIEKILGEALFNAYQHAQAKSVRIQINYDPRHLVVKVRDDGVGLDQAVIDAGGREGHFGLVGMRERAAKIGGAMLVRNHAEGGAEVELAVPAAAAYRTGRRPPWDLWRSGVDLAHDV